MRRVAGVVCLVGLLASTSAEAQRGSDHPSLVVLLVIDQLAVHYLRRWGDLTDQGIGKLIRRGAYYRRGVFEYANTETAPGHATIATGTWPSTHGLVANTWYAPSGARVYCVEDPKYGRSPANLMAPGIGDAIELATGGKSKSISFATKDRAAIALGGSKPDLVGWYDENAGRVIAGTWEGLPKPPAWFNEVTLKHSAPNAFGLTWDRFRKLEYARIASADDRKFEANLVGLGRTFPRKLGQGLTAATDIQWRKVYPASPPAIEALLELALAALEKEELGSRGTIDYLAISFGTLDYVGHWYGSDSQESLDVLLRIDAALGKLIDAIERKIGSGGAIFVLTGDHGAMPTPEAHATQRRIAPEPILTSLADVLKREFPKEDVTVAALNSPRIYLGPTRAGADRTKISRRAAEAIRGLPGVVDAVAIEDLGRWADPMRTYYMRSCFAGRNADVLFLHAAHDLIDTTDVEYQGVGTSHGSPYGYDTTVPIIVGGPRVRGSVDDRPYRMTRVAPTIAALLEIEPPAAAVDGPLPAVR